MSDPSSYGKIPPGIELGRNPITQRMHRREVGRQVWLPLAVVLVVVAGGIYLADHYQLGSLQKWAELASIGMITLVMLLLLIPLLLVLVLTFAVSQALRQLPPVARRTQRAIEKIQHQVRSGADISIQPLIQIKSFLAMVEAFFGRRRS